MSNQHPITPPLELVQQWIKECDNPEKPRWQEYEQDIATLAAQWGADQELEACCEWVSPFSHDDCYYEDKLRTARRPQPPSLKEQALVKIAENLRAARRPKPPSLKEQALEVLNITQKGYGLAQVDLDTIRKALEALSDD